MYERLQQHGHLRNVHIPTFFLNFTVCIKSVSCFCKDWALFSLDKALFGCKTEISINYSVTDLIPLHDSNFTVQANFWLTVMNDICDVGAFSVHVCRPQALPWAHHHKMCRDEEAGRHGWRGRHACKHANIRWKCLRWMYPVWYSLFVDRQLIRDHANFIVKSCRKNCIWTETPFKVFMNKFAA